MRCTRGCLESRHIVLSSRFFLSLVTMVTKICLHFGLYKTKLLIGTYKEILDVVRSFEVLHMDTAHDLIHE